MASDKEQALIDMVKVILPTNFVAKETDAKLLAYLNLCLGDINASYTPPTYYTLDTIPTLWSQPLIFGATLYANLFLQMNYALKDFTYSDYGLSLNIDRTGKLSAIYDKQLHAFEEMKWGLKKTEILRVNPLGNGYPRYQSQMGQFLRIMYGTTYAGNSVPNG